MSLNPLNAIRNLTERGQEKMAYDMEQRAGNPTPLGSYIKQRTFREQMQDQIAYHKAKIEDLENVLNSMTPEVEKFVEALQKVNL